MIIYKIKISKKDYLNIFININRRLCITIEHFEDFSIDLKERKNSNSNS